ncbi:MAG: Peptidase M15 [Candidatus Tokpelaia hoelldobleri]|uniref:Murein endopeptidase K n=1 Tax=Candidatus Tokpelaia hoelldobleri TaxID=1902579 RepID=A0A1U9JUR7_9HYPH|nr:MAG: Peptidase M15 [Candidatus Tokpelaia hoelldoblerii]
MRKSGILKHKTGRYCKLKNFIAFLGMTLAVSASCFIVLAPQALAAGAGSRSAKTKQVSSARSKARPPVRVAKQANQAKLHALPGVADNDIPLNTQKYARTVTLASAGNFARGLPKGVQVARKGVQTACFNPRLVSLLGTIQNHYKRPVIITSGYRSPAHNRRVHGAKHSLHMSCSAADIKVSGVHKSELARFVRALPNRGGVGTYCNQIIHVDVGARRDWNWGCSKKR